MGRRGRGDGLKAWTGGSGCTLGRQPPHSRPSPRQAAAPAPLSLAGQAAAPPQLSRLRLGTSSLKPHRGRGVRLVRPAAYPSRPPDTHPAGSPWPCCRVRPPPHVPPPQRTSVLRWYSVSTSYQYCGASKKKQDEVCEKFAFETIGNRLVQKFAPTAQWVFLETQRMV